MAEKLFLGAKLRKLREARGWTLEACAERLGLSPSYLSQIETNQRPATARVLIALTRAFHVDASLFDLEGDARLLAEKAAAAGVAIEYYEEPGLLHVFPLTPTPEGRAARRIIVERIGGGTESTRR